MAALDRSHLAKECQMFKKAVLKCHAAENCTAPPVLPGSSDLTNTQTAKAASKLSSTEQGPMGGHTPWIPNMLPVASKCWPLANFQPLRKFPVPKRHPMMGNTRRLGELSMPRQPREGCTGTSLASPLQLGAPIANDLLPANWRIHLVL